MTEFRSYRLRIAPIARLAGLVAALLGPSPASARTPDDTTTKSELLFALVVGVNRSTEPDLSPLRYADDDAVRYNDLFVTLGAHTELLTTLDDNTKRLHPGERATPATLTGFSAAIERIASKVAEARAAGKNASVYLLYAGHGIRDTHSGKGFLTLEDARLSAQQLQDLVVDRVPATQFHFIVDACHSEFLTSARGPGGSRRKIESFMNEVAIGIRDPRVGLLFATSPEAKTFEYEGFQSGVFSHLVRSGLYGGADFDLDGRISYDEIQRFVERATAAIPNEKYRPTVRALRPVESGAILDIRSSLAAGRIEVDGTVVAAHRVLEDSNGVRILDFHNANGQALHMVRPAGPLSLAFEDVKHRSVEIDLPEGQNATQIATLVPRERTTLARGGADNAFRKLFELPFDPRALQEIKVHTDDYFTVLEQVDRDRDAQRRESRLFWSRAAFTTAAIATALSVGSGIALWQLSSEPGGGSNNNANLADERNPAIRRWQNTALISGGIGVAAALTGLGITLWPTSDNRGTMGE
ncbi:MAG: caspase family protein [Deltaproteobacteria bacterium]|nr:caspase family protein [Deltaproteobacteria bacterium]